MCFSVYIRISGLIGTSNRNIRCNWTWTALDADNRIQATYSALVGYTASAHFPSLSLSLSSFPSASCPSPHSHSLSLSYRKHTQTPDNRQTHGKSPGDSIVIVDGAWRILYRTPTTSHVLSMSCDAVRERQKGRSISHCSKNLPVCLSPSLQRAAGYIKLDSRNESGAQGGQQRDFVRLIFLIQILYYIILYV